MAHAAALIDACFSWPAQAANFLPYLLGLTSQLNPAVACGLQKTQPGNACSSSSSSYRARADRPAGLDDMVINDEPWSSSELAQHVMGLPCVSFMACRRQHQALGLPASRNTNYCCAA